MRVLGWLVVLALVGVAVLGFVVLAPYGPRSETFVEVAPGTSTEGIGAEMERAGVIRSRYGLDLLRVVKGGRLKAGEYRFDHPASLVEVYARLRRGDVYTVTVSVPEGYNIFDVAAAVEMAGLGTREAFLAAERGHTELLAGVLPAGAVRPASLEGFLFPDTYKFSRHATPEAMLGAMVRRFRVAAGQLGLRPAETMRVVTLASIVEKEVRVPEERPLVAGVFGNRLRRGMPLQTDPTVIYAALVENRYRGTIYASDLQSPSAYNTYRHAGLPPGPIANPGVDALRAAMHPAETDYLYFVSDAAGHSRFSAELGEHERQVEAYRQAAKP